MSQFKDVLNNIIIGNRSGADLYNRIFVVSEYNNVTNWLLEHKKTGAPGIYVKFLNDENYAEALDELCLKLIALNRNYEEIKLDQKVADEFIINRIEFRFIKYKGNRTIYCFFIACHSFASCFSQSINSVKLEKT